MPGQPASLEDWYAEEFGPDAGVFSDVDALTYARTQLTVAARVIEYGLNFGCDKITAKSVASAVIGLALPYGDLCDYVGVDPSVLFDNTGIDVLRTQQLAPVVDLAKVRAVKNDKKLSAPRHLRRNLQEMPYVLDRTCDTLEEEVHLLLPGEDEESRRWYLVSLAGDLEETCRGLAKEKGRHDPHLLDVASRKAVVAQKLVNYFSQSGQMPKELLKLTHAIGKYIEVVRPNIDYIVYKAAATADVLAPKDLQQEAIIGLMQALGRYDLSRSTLVMSFCTKRIHGSVIDAIRNFTRDTRTRDDVRFHKMLAQGMTDEQIALKMGISADKLVKKKAHAANSGVRFLSDNYMLSLVPATQALEQEFEREFDVEVIHQLLERVDREEANFIAMRFGIQPYDRPHTLKEIGNVYGYTESRASQVQTGIMETLRRRARTLL